MLRFAKRNHVMAAKASRPEKYYSNPSGFNVHFSINLDNFVVAFTCKLFIREQRASIASEEMRIKHSNFFVAQK